MTINIYDTLTEKIYSFDVNESVISQDVINNYKATVIEQIISETGNESENVVFGFEDDGTLIDSNHSEYSIAKIECIIRIYERLQFSVNA